MDLSTALAITLPIFIYIAFKLYLNKLERQKSSKLYNEYKDEKIKEFDSKANFMGRKSAGYKQIRGNGVLLLTEEEIVFERWFPEKRIVIPINSVQNTEIVNSFLGKSKSKSILKIDFRDKEGNSDSCGWIVEDYEDWIANIKSFQANC